MGSLHVRLRSLAIIVLVSALCLLTGATLAATSTATPVRAPAFTCADVSQIPQAECNALVAIYNTTDGPTWTNRSGWMQNNTPCSWYGISCMSGHVRELSLHQNQLSGSIPAELGNLSSLTGIWLYSNQLSGSIPPQLGDLSSLIYLDLSANQLSGSIPAELGKLSALTELTLRGNRLNGSIPISLGNLSSLKYLDLSTNELSGSIPAELGNLVSLIGLGLYSTQLSGSIPPELGNLINVTWLDLSRSRLNGRIPTELGNLVSLTDLWLYANQLSGSIPPELGHLANLKYLGLYSNHLSGSIPPELGNLTSLRGLGLNENQLTGIIPSSLGNLTSLTGLGLGGNLLSGSIPISLGNLSDLTELWLYSNQLSGSIPSHLGNLSRLEVLHLAGNQLGSSIPLSLGNLTSLINLDLSGNQLNGSIPSQLGNLASLKYLNLSYNQLSGSIPPQLGNLSSLTDLWLHENQLSGSIPPQLGNLSSLTGLGLFSNQFSGSIPQELGNLSNLTKLILFSNQLTGSIPQELGNLSNLTELWLYSNQLSGSIPQKLGNLTKLKILSLSFNQLSGSIPQELGNLSNLTRFYLSTNQLSGRIPPALGTMTSLISLDLDSNQLSGTIPAELGNLSSLTNLWLSANQLNGNIPQELGNLSNLVILNLSYNRLTAIDPVLLTFLQAKDPDWAETQTIAPTNVLLSPLSTSQLTVEWTPIAYTADSGYYEIEYGTATTGPFTLHGVTESKSDASYILTMLSPATVYYVRVRSYTPAHDGVDSDAAWDDQQNNLRSDYSQVVFATTLPEDATEPNDTCAQANSIALDGMPQRHTFHDAGDEDWVIFDAIADKTYRIEAQLPADSPADVVLELYDTCAGSNLDGFDKSFTPAVRLDFKAPTTGSIYLRLLNNDAGVFGPSVAYDLSIRPLNDTPEVGAAILVAGREKYGDNLQPNIHSVISRAYALFVDHKYTNDDLMVIATDDSLPGYGRSATLANLEWAITEWAPQHLSPGDPFTIYLMSHGKENIFYLDGPGNQLVTPAMLDGWLDQLQAAVPNLKVNVIIEACQSGSFIFNSQRIAGQGRVVITSSDKNTDAYASDVGAYFSDYFIVALHGSHLYSSFLRARENVAKHNSIQKPQLEANGNGIPNEDSDYVIASTRGFGFPGTFGDPWPPYIAQAQGPTVITNRRGIIRAEVRDDSSVRTVWAVVYPPSYRPPDTSGELVPEPLTKILLSRLNDGWYAGEYAGFDEVGTYRIVIQATDNKDLSARPVVVVVENGDKVFLPFLTR